MITGGTSGLGLEFVKIFIKKDFFIHIISRNEEDLIDKSKKIDCCYEICDVMEISQIEEISKKYDKGWRNAKCCIKW